MSVYHNQEVWILKTKDCEREFRYDLALLWQSQHINDIPLNPLCLAILIFNKKNYFKLLIQKYP